MQYLQCSIQPNERGSGLLHPWHEDWSKPKFKLSQNWVLCLAQSRYWYWFLTCHTEAYVFLRGCCTAFPSNHILWARLDQWRLLLHSLCLSHYRHKYLLSLLQELPVPHMKPVYKSTEEVGPKLSTQGQLKHFSFGQANDSRGSTSMLDLKLDWKGGMDYGIDYGILKKPTQVS